MTEQKPLGSGDELRSKIEQTLIVYQTLREMRNNSPTGWSALLDDVMAAIQAYANQERIDELRRSINEYWSTHPRVVHPMYLYLLVRLHELKVRLATLTKDKGEETI